MSALVAMGGERHGRNLGRQRLAANDEVKVRAGSGHVLRDIAHGDRAVDRGTEAAGGHDADLAAIGRRDDGSLAGRSTAFGLDADAHTRSTVPDLSLKALGSWEAPLLAAALLDRPDQARLDG